MKKIYFFLLFCLFTFPLCAQMSDDAPYTTNEGTLIGFGGYNLKNTYLSDSKYDGWGLSALNERMKLVKWNWSSQQILHLDLCTADHPAGTVRSYAGFIDYSYGMHYRFQPADGLKILAGASAGAMFGFVYNTQNGNNPTALHLDANLNLSAAALYTFYWKDYPLTARYQVDMPFVGVLFSPHYGQSYYEIFDVGNTSGIVQFSSLHNKFAMRNYLSVDFPVGKVTMRLGYMNQIYNTSVNDIHARYTSSSFMIGFVREFVSYGGKRLKQRQMYQSAYY